VPSVLFYDMPKHILYLQQMLRDFELGEHLLLIGNQVCDSYTQLTAVYVLLASLTIAFVRAWAKTSL
jgi:hypothetical protein